MRQSSKLAAITAVLLAAALNAPAQAASGAPQVTAVPLSASPPVPAGLKVTCMIDGEQLQTAATCPIVKYRGITTWAYSFIDNRVSLAIVSYDARNNVIRNVTLDGTRYVWQIGLAPGSGKVTFTGQSDTTVTVNLADLGPL
jgi:hypothetical protein